MEIASSLAVVRSLNSSVDSVAKAISPDSLASARFSELMQLEPTTPVQLPVDGISSVYNRGAVSSVENASIGDRILSGMQGLSNDVQQSWATVKTALDNSSNMTTTDMLKLQMGLTQMSIQYDLVGKAISRSTQNLDQLLKMQ